MSLLERNTELHAIGLLDGFWVMTLGYKYKQQKLKQTSST